MATLNEKQKQEITEALKAYVAKYPSQNKAATSLNVSSATISQILNGKIELISDEMWRNLAAQVMSVRKGWSIIATRPLKAFMTVLHDAQHCQNMTWIVAPAGCGKTTAATLYTGNNKEVFMLKCSTDMRVTDFLEELATAVGIPQEEQFRGSSRKRCKQIVSRLIKMESPLLVFDEADKLSDTLLNYFITLYNELEDKVGIVCLSTNYIEKRMSKGLRRTEKGYQEIYSRFDSNFYKTSSLDVNKEADRKELYNICYANGVTSDEEIADILKEYAGSQNNLRRLRKVTHVKNTKRKLGK